MLFLHKHITWCDMVFKCFILRHMWTIVGLVTALLATVGDRGLVCDIPWEEIALYGCVR